MKHITFKYIIVDTGAILFNENTTHAQVAKGFDKVYAAGFVVIKNYDVVIKCYGGSESIGIVSIPQKDKVVIKDLLEPVSSIKYFGFSVREHYKTNQ